MLCFTWHVLSNLNEALSTVLEIHTMKKEKKSVESKVVPMLVYIFCQNKNLKARAIHFHIYEIYEYKTIEDTHQ